MTKNEFNKTCEDYESAEKELDKLIEERNSYTVNSLEVKANEAKIKDQIWQCVFEIKKDESEAETLTLVWNSFDEIDNEKDRILLYRVMQECLSFWQGVPSSFLEDTLESQAGEPDTKSVEDTISVSSESQSTNGEV
jgi:hypothetical protein